MSITDQLYAIRDRMELANQSRRTANAIGRRGEAQYLNLELADLEFEESELMEKMEEAEA